MKIKVEKSYIIYILLGISLWFASIILRDLNLSNNIGSNFILGVLPNFAVVFLGFGIGMIYYPILINKIKIPLKKSYINYTKYYPYLLLCLIFVLLLLSEYIHQLFLNSPWDNFDIIISILAIIIVVILYKISNIKHYNNKIIQ